MTSKTIETEPSPVGRSIAVIGLLAAALALAGCGDTGPTGPGMDGLVFEADLGVGQVLPIDPAQRLLVGRMTVANRGETTVSFETGGCPVFLVATSEDGRMWRQRDHVACVAIARRITIEPGASVELATPRASSADIVADTGDEGRYRFEVVLDRSGGPDVVVEARELAL